MNQEEQLKVERTKTRIEEKSKKIPFKYTKIGRLLEKDLIDIILDKIDNHYYKKETQRLVKEGYQGNFDDYEALIEYEERINSNPVKTQKNEDGSCTYFYPDGNKAIVGLNIPDSIFPSPEIAEICMNFNKEDNLRIIEEKKKQLFCKYTGIEPEIIKTMSWDKIDEAILTSSKPSSRLRRVLVPQKKKVN